ncbi:MAG TPA: ABC transporter permease [Patescibacteria group bacterium]|nr:ABC transporter permease [Patescibacteria group bacterium]
MNYAQIIRSAIKALRGNILRTVLTMLGIIIGIASVILIISLGQGATSSITDQVSSLGTNLIFITPGKQTPGRPPQATNTLKYDDAEALADKSRMPDVSAVSAQVSTQAEVVANGQNKNTQISGVDASYSDINSLELDQGEFIAPEDVAGYGRVAVLGPDVVTDIFGADANPIGETVTIKSRSFRVIGVTKAKGSTGFTNPDETVYIPVTTALKVLLGQDSVQAILVEGSDPQKVEDMQQEITDFLLDQHKITDPALQDFTVTTSKDALSTVNNITGILTALLSGIAGISLVVGGIGIMNIMLVTVTERTKEIGLLKAIGAKRSDILTQFLIEAVVLTVTGGIAGIIMGISLSFLATRFLPIPFVLQPTAILLAVGVSTIVGVVFGIYPAQRAAKLSPIEALRYE